ncbi:hypothetical protein VNO77_40256 [Canavalia gladiata]|uniref:BHLH domain-containing protein n=1 Tax=Canavalia gladiata TaxID=3824 RepID=A0AAN9JXF7_CANGL
MALETPSSIEFSNFIIYDTISTTPFGSQESSETSFLLEENRVKYDEHDPTFDNNVLLAFKHQCGEPKAIDFGGEGRKKRRRKTRVSKNKEEAETQRMIHITVERNRRKQMNERLAILRSLMPEAYVQRGDQASIVGGAIEFVKELEHLLQTLEAQKWQVLHQGVTLTQTSEDMAISKFMRPPFAHFFVYPQHKWSQDPKGYKPHTKEAIVDIEVTLIETHANLRILSWRSPKQQLSKLVSGFETLYLTILHLNVTTMDPLVLYSISTKVEEGCRLGSVDDIAKAIHHLLK